MKKRLLPIAVAILVAAAAVYAIRGGLPRTGEVLRVRDGRVISFDRMITELAPANIVLVGEVHDQPLHHRLELAVIRALHRSGRPIAIGLEMFRAEDQGILDAWTAGTLPRERFLPAYYDNWRMPWPLYRDIFQYARAQHIPMVGLNIPERIAEDVARNGFASLSAAQKQGLPPGVTCDVDATYRAFIRRAFTEHRHGLGSGFQHFCEAQLVWDKAMAWHLVEYEKKHPGTTVVVLAGVGHAWRRGIPAEVARSAKLRIAVVLPVVPDRVEQNGISTGDADYLMLP